MASPATTPTVLPAIAAVLLFFGSGVGLGLFVLVYWDDVADVLVEETELEAVLANVSLVEIELEVDTGNCVKILSDEYDPGAVVPSISGRILGRLITAVKPVYV